MRHGAIFLPGIITPAESSFGRVRDALGSDASVVLRDLAVYDSDEPRPHHGLNAEVDAVMATASEAGFDRFHMVGFSAGGAVAAAVAARHGDRLVSLVLNEPAWLGNEGIGEGERRAFAEAAAAAELPLERALAEFARVNLAPGVVPAPPPDGAPPPWLAKRPAGIRAVVAAFAAYDLDIAALRALPCPVLYVLSRLSNPDLYEVRAERCRALFADFTLEIFDERHHFDPPHRAEPERFAALLMSFWDRAEARRPG